MTIDNSDLMNDSDLAGMVVIIQRQQAIVNHLATLTTTAIPALGQVTSGAKNVLIRQAAFTAGQSSIHVISDTPIWPPCVKNGHTYAADLIQWEGVYYQVSDYKDWSNFGLGFYEADCVSTALIDPPPGP